MDALSRTPWPDEAELAPEDGTAPLDTAALARFLAGRGHALDPDPAPRRFRGGLANLNWCVSVDGRPFVLRRAPSGELPPGAHDMAREHRVLSRLHAVLPLAPRSVLLCEDPGVLGAPFQLIEYRDGRVLRGDRLDPAVATPDVGERLTDVLVDTLAAIHAVDPARAGLSDLGRPDGFVERAIAGWAKRGAAAAEGGAAERCVADLARWLDARRDAAPRNPPTLLHCDFKLDNLIFARDALVPVAVVDWDMATRGEPLFDLATMLSYWTEPGDPECMHRLGQMPTARHGFPAREEVARRYAERTGLALDGFEVLRILCLFKLGVVFLQLFARWRAGSLGDERYAGFEAIGNGILDFAHDLAHPPAR